MDLHAWPPWAATPRATFVTVYVEGQLNGCIGSLEPRRPLVADISHNAYHAAFEDPRFARVSAVDVDNVSVHLAILGPLQEMEIAEEGELLQKMRVGTDGIVLDDGARRATFLPAVWEKIPDPAMFIAQLKRKGRFGADEWPASMHVYRFEVEEFDRGDLNSNA